MHEQYGPIRKPVILVVQMLIAQQQSIAVQRTGYTVITLDNHAMGYLPLSVPLTYHAGAK